MYINWTGNRVTIELEATTEALPLLTILQRLPSNNAILGVLKARLEHWNNERGRRKNTATHWSR